MDSSSPDCVKDCVETVVFGAGVNAGEVLFWVLLVVRIYRIGGGKEKELTAGRLSKAFPTVNPSSS